MTTTEQPNSTPNVFRDGKLVVAPVHNPVFPPRCIKTGRDVDAANHKLVVDVQPQIQPSATAEFAGTVLAGQIGRAAVQAATAMAARIRLPLNVAISDQSRRRLRWQGRLATLLMCVPVALIVFLVAMDMERFARRHPTLMWIFLGVGLVSFVIGITLFLISKVLVLQQTKCDGQYVWLNGACPAFVATLPEFKPNSTASPE